MTVYRHQSRIYISYGLLVIISSRLTLLYRNRNENSGLTVDNTLFNSRDNLRAGKLLTSGTGLFYHFCSSQGLWSRAWHENAYRLVLWMLYRTRPRLSTRPKHKTVTLAWNGLVIFCDEWNLRESVNALSPFSAYQRCFEADGSRIDYW